MSTAPARRIGFIFFGDPNGYPPIVNCARSLAESGWKVDIVCREERTHPDVALPRAVTVRRLPGRPGRAWRDYAAFVMEAPRQLADDCAVVVGHDMHGLWPAARAAAKRRIPLVYHCHDFADDSRRLPLGSRWVKRMERRLAPRARLAIVPDADRGRVVERELALPRPVLVLPNAPRRSAVPRTGTLRSELAARGLRFDRIVIRQGRIGPNHGIESTVRSMGRWSSPAWGFVLIGPGEPAFLAHIAALAREAGAADRLVVLPVRNYDDILGCTVDADLGHALYEPANINHVQMGTASNKVIEYMAAGIPCLVSSSSSTARLVEEHACGVAADPASPDDVARAINAILARPEDLARMGAAGRRAFDETLSYESGFARLSRELEPLVSPGGAPWR